MKLLSITSLAAALLISWVAPARGETIVYQYPNSPLFFVLQGKVTENKRDQTVSVADAVVGSTLYFPSDAVQVYKVDTVLQEFNKKLGQAGRNADQLFQAALWALKHGLIRDFHTAIGRVLEVDSRHAGATRVVELKKLLEKQLPDSPDAEAMLKRVAGRGAFRIQKSAHFLLATDTPAKPSGDRKKTRAAERLDLMEKAYESFLYWFHAHDLKLEPPTGRLLSVLYTESGDYTEFARGVSGLSSEGHTGLFDRQRNVSVFLDQAGDSPTRDLRQSASKRREDATAAKKKRDASVTGTVRGADLLEALAEMAQDGADAEAVSREVARQMAFSAGLFAPGVEVPAWVEQGLARFFELPREAPWTGFGAPSELRLAAYRALEKASGAFGLEPLLGDQLSGLNEPFLAPTLSGSGGQGGGSGIGIGGGRGGGIPGGADGGPPGGLGGAPGAAGAGAAGVGGGATNSNTSDGIAFSIGEAQAWALTYHLMEAHPKELIEFYRSLSGMRPDVPLNPDVIVALFEKSLGQKPADIDKEWRAAMRPAKSEVERITGKSPIAATTK
jgi:hypothetical protein